MIDPRLQTLRVLRAHGTVTATADVLHLTPSTVSQQIRQLSGELGVQLLEPNGRRVRLTSAARTLLEHADRLYAQAELIHADLAAHRDGTAGHLRICGVSSALKALVAPAAARLLEAHPGLTVELSEEEADHCYDLLLTGRADIAVVIPTPDSPSPDDPRFEQQSLLDEAQDLLVPSDHPFAPRDSVALAEAAGETWIGSRVPECWQILLVACAAAGFTPRIAHRATDWTAMSALVAHGFGVTLIPRLAYVPPEDAVVRVPIGGDAAPSRRLITCIRRGSVDQPGIAAGLDALREASRLRVGVVDATDNLTPAAAQ